MKNKIIIPTILFIVVLIFSFSLLLQKKDNNHQQNGQSQIILFYGIGCPHCAIVEEYIKNNNIESKISFAQKEVYYNQTNQNELTEKAKICGIPETDIGVPLLWDGEKCLIGDVDIINFLKEKTNSQ